MTRSLNRAPLIHKTVRYALSGAAMSLALAVLSSAAESAPFVCDDDTTNHNFTCGSNATSTTCSGRRGTR